MIIVEIYKIIQYHCDKLFEKTNTEAGMKQSVSFAADYYYYYFDGVADLL